MERIWLRYSLSIDFELETVEGSDEQYAFEQLLHQRVGRELAAELPPELVNRLAELEARIGQPHWTQWAVRTNNLASEPVALDAPALQEQPVRSPARSASASDAGAADVSDVSTDDAAVIDARDVFEDI